MLGRKWASRELYAKPTKYPLLDRFPSHISNRNLDLVLDELDHSKRKLRTLVGELDSSTNIYFWTAAGLRKACGTVFDISDVILFPTIPTVLSERAYQQVYKYFERRDMTEVDFFHSFRW